MRRHAVVIPALLGALALAGTASAAGNGAETVKDEGCVTNVFATTCTVVRTVTNSTVTPSGNISYVTNGAVERKVTFAFGGTYDFTSSIHSHGLRKAGEYHTTSDHYAEQSEYVSGQYRLTCVSSYDIHWTNGEAQFTRYELECTTP